MALGKSVQTPTGVAATYWIPGHIRIDKVAGTLAVVLLGFISEGARRAECRPVLGMPDLVFSLEDFPGEADIRCIPSPVLYAAVKARIAAAAEMLREEDAGADESLPLLALLEGAEDC